MIDFYGNPVVDAPIAFSGTGVSEWIEVGYENVNWTDSGIPGTGVGAGDGCFTWRDYGLDDDPQTADMGTYNNSHDAFDTDGDGENDAAEVSEVFNDWGLDGVPNTFDEGEGNMKWDGYSMINCEAVVKTDKDGYARIQAKFVRELCVFNSQSQEGICNWDPFDASMSATLLIPQITTSDPLDINLVRSPEACTP